jgi:poly-beta-hydroxyalkanoate depolymerase
MLYLAYQTQSDLMEPVRGLARTALATYRSWVGGGGDSSLWRNLAAAWELVARAKLTHVRPSYGISTASPSAIARYR